MEPEKDCLDEEDVKRIWQKTIDETQADGRRIGKKKIVAKFYDTYFSLHPDSNLDIYDSNGLTRICPNPEVQPEDIVFEHVHSGEAHITLDDSGFRVFSVLNGVPRPESDPNAHSGIVIDGFCCDVCQRNIRYSIEQQIPMSNAYMHHYASGKYQRTNPATGKKYICKSCNNEKITTPKNDEIYERSVELNKRLRDVPERRFGKTTLFDVMLGAFSVHKQKIIKESNTQKQTDFKN